MKVRQNYQVDVVEIDENTVKMSIATLTGEKVRMRQEFTIAKYPHQTVEEVCVATYPHAFEDVSKPETEEAQ